MYLNQRNKCLISSIKKLISNLLELFLSVSNCVCFCIQYYKVVEVMIIHKAIFKNKVKKEKRNKIKHPSILFAPYKNMVLKFSN